MLDSLAFEWNHSRRRRIAQLRTAVECDLRRRVPVVIASADSGEWPVHGYAGCSDGRVRILDQLERLTGDAASYSRTEASTSWEHLLCARPEVGGDLVTIGCSRRQLPPSGFGPDTFVLPYRMHFGIRLGDADKPWIERVSRRERRYFKTMQQAHDYSLELSNRPEDLEWFFHNAYEPTMALRHGHRTRGEQLGVAQSRVLSRGVLAFVRAGGQRVAGILCRWENSGQVLCTRLFGVLGGDSRLYADGAGKAMYFLLVSWAERVGVKTVDLAGTEAFVATGTFQWKRRLAAEVARAPNHHAGKRVLFRVARDTPAVRRFLVDNPMLHWTRGGELAVLQFLDPRLPSPNVSWSGVGIRRTVAVDLDAFFDAVQAWQ